MGLVLGALFIWGIDYRLAATLDLDFVGAALAILGGVGVVSATVAYARNRRRGFDQSRRQAGTSL